MKWNFEAAPALKDLPPHFSPKLYKAVRVISPLYFKSALNNRKLNLINGEIIAHEYKNFYEGKNRLILAFRHPYRDDAQTMNYMLLKHLPKIYRHRFKKNKITPAHFVYNRGVTRWAGGITTWIFPRFGALPVYHRQQDKKSFFRVLDYLTTGSYPLALAPEGQVTYHNHSTAEIESGTAGIACMAMKRLMEAKQNPEVKIIPISISYTYLETKKLTRIKRLLSYIYNKLELPVPKLHTHAAKKTKKPWQHPEIRKQLYTIMKDAEEHIFSFLENLYASRYGYPHLLENKSKPIRERLYAIIDTALSVGENYHALPHDADTLSRIFTLRNAGWRWMHRPDIYADLSNPKGLKKHSADIVALETHLYERHMQLIDLLFYYRPNYCTPESSFNRLIEGFLNLADTINRIEGGQIGTRYNWQLKDITVKADSPISGYEYYSYYSYHRKETITRLTQTIQETLEKLSSE